MDILGRGKKVPKMVTCIIIIISMITVASTIISMLIIMFIKVMFVKMIIIMCIKDNVYIV